MIGVCGVVIGVWCCDWCVVLCLVCGVVIGVCGVVIGVLCCYWCVPVPANLPFVTFKI